MDNKMNDIISLEYYSADGEVDADGNLLPTYGEVSRNDLREVDGYDLPVHKNITEHK